MTEEDLFWHIIKVIHRFKEPGINWNEGDDDLKRQSAREAVPIMLSVQKYMRSRS